MRSFLTNNNFLLMKKHLLLIRKNFLLMMVLAATCGALLIHGMVVLGSRVGENIEFRQQLSAIRERPDYIPVEKTFAFGHDSLYIYGLFFEDGDRKKPQLVYRSNNISTSIQWLSPDLLGGGGFMGCRGRLWVDGANLSNEVRDTIELNVIFTDVPSNQRCHYLKLHL